MVSQGTAECSDSEPAIWRWIKIMCSFKSTPIPIIQNSAPFVLVNNAPLRALISKPWKFERMTGLRNHTFPFFWKREDVKEVI